MLEKKNIALCIVFSVLSCGLYSWYWLYCLAEDMNRLTGREGAMSGGFVLLLTVVTCGIYGWYWLYVSRSPRSRAATRSAHSILSPLRCNTSFAIPRF